MPDQHRLFRWRLPGRLRARSEFLQLRSRGGCRYRCRYGRRGWLGRRGRWHRWRRWWWRGGYGRRCRRRQRCCECWAELAVESPAATWPPLKSASAGIVILLPPSSAWPDSGRLGPVLFYPGGDPFSRHLVASGQEQIRVDNCITAASSEWGEADSRMGACPDTCGWRRTCPPKPTDAPPARRYASRRWGCARSRPAHGFTGFRAYRGT